MKNYIPFIFLFFFLSSYSEAQTTKELNKDEQAWLAYFSQIRVADKWGLWFDVSYRRDNHFLKESFQSVIRPGIIYYLPNKVKVAGGYAYLNHFPDRMSRNIIQPEHRIWEQILWSQKYKGFGTRQNIRLEHRFRRKLKDNNHLSADYSFNHRIRYNLGITIPLRGEEAEPKSFFLILSDEIMFNFGKEIVYNYFDQNRASIAFGYYLNKDLNIQFGYMNVFQQLASGYSYNSNHVVRITIVQNLDLRRKEEIIEDKNL